jgi:hypothetical protein
MLTLIFPYYDAPKMLEFQMSVWEKYSSKPRIIVVDDASPKNSAFGILSKSTYPNLSLFRIEENIRWNAEGAKNLGFHNASGWCISTDIDHVIPDDTVSVVETYAKLGSLRRESFYRFLRKRMPDDARFFIHRSSYLIHAEDFWAAGGYDEDYSGYYAGDLEFSVNVLEAKYNLFMLHEYLHLYGKKTIPDAQTSEWERDINENKKVLALKKDGAFKALKPHLRFSWKQLI